MSRLSTRSNHEYKNIIKQLQTSILHEHQYYYGQQVLIPLQLYLIEVFKKFGAEYKTQNDRTSKLIDIY